MRVAHCEQLLLGEWRRIGHQHALQLPASFSLHPDTYTGGEMPLLDFFKRGCSAAEMQQQAEQDAAKSAQAQAQADAVKQSMPLVDKFSG